MAKNQWLARIWLWVGQKWRWDALLSVGAFGMIKLGEYGVGVTLLAISGLAVTSKISQWGGIIDSARLTRGIRYGGYLFVVATVIMLTVITNKIKGSTPWSNLAKPGVAQFDATLFTVDPVIHIEPENALIWSTIPGRTKGFYNLDLNSTIHEIDHLSITETYFVAEKSSSDLLFKSLGGITPQYEHPSVIKVGDKFPFAVDFRSYKLIAKELMLHSKGPSLFGVKILARYRRHLDGKPFTFSKGYAAINPTAPGIYDSDSEHDRAAKDSGNKCPEMMILSDGFNWQTDSLNADEFQNWTSVQLPPCGKKVEGNFPIQPKGVLKLTDLEFYFNLPGHWVPVEHDVTHGTYR